MDQTSDVHVGRDAELGRLVTWSQEAQAGRGRLVLVSGRAGLGKSRLCQELAGRLGPDVHVGRGSCPSGGVAPPLWPWERALRGLPVAALVAEAGGAASTSTRPQEALRRLADLADAVAAAGHDRPLVLVLEDLHWADSTSVDLLRHLLVELPFSALLVVATCRPDTPGPLAERMGFLASDRATELLPLRPLPDLEAADLVRARRPDATEATVRSICGSAAGNPLFLRWLAGSGYDQGHALADSFVAELPSDARRVMAAAAVFGLETPADAVAKVCDLSQPDVDRAAAAGQTSGLLASAAPLRFAHELLREAVLGGLGPAERAEWHGRWADLLEPTDPPAATVVAHLVAAGRPADAARTTRWATRAAVEAAAAGAWQEEAALRELACDFAITAGASAEAIITARIALATSLFRAGALTASLRAVELAAEAAIAMGRPDLAVEALFVVTGVDDDEVWETLGWLTTALLARSDLDNRSRARLLVRDAFRRERGLPPAASIEVGEEVLEAALAADDPLATLEACRLLVAVPRLPADLGTRLTLADIAARASNRLGDPISRLWPLVWRIDALIALGLPISRETDAVLHLAEQCRLPLVRWHALRQQAAIAGVEGRMTAAYEHSAAATAISRQIGDWSGVGLGLAFVATMHALLGERPRLEPEQERSLLRGPRDNVALVAGHVWALAVDGRVADARAVIEEVADVLESDRHDGRTIGGIQMLALAALALGDRAMISRCRDALERCCRADGAQGSGTVVLGGAVANIVGATSEALGETPRALAEYRTAIAVDTRIGATVPLIQAHLGAARCLAGSTTAAERAEARGHLTQVAVWMVDVEPPGLALEASRIASLLDTGPETGPLSPREHEVALLVAQGLPNRRIAAALVLSERTVESHVRNALRKLQLTRREELVAWVIHQEHPA